MISPFVSYPFAVELRPFWEQFWVAAGGTSAGCLEAASKLKLDAPAEFVSSLHKFLFGVRSGSKVGIKAAAKDWGGMFKTYLEELLQELGPDTDTVELGVSPRQLAASLVEILKLELQDEQDLMRRVNSVVPGLGTKLWNRFLLLKFGNTSFKDTADHLRQVASRLREKAAGY